MVRFTYESALLKSGAKAIFMKLILKNNKLFLSK